jgi:hypothetical protein
MAEHILMKLLAEVGRERSRQDAKFGPQDYPLVPGNSSRELYHGSADAQKRINDRAIQDGTRTGDHVLLEEVFEALSADGPLEAVTELVQVAAVALLLAEMEIRRHPEALPPRPFAPGNLLRGALGNRGADLLADRVNHGEGILEPGLNAREQGNRGAATDN